MKTSNTNQEDFYEVDAYCPSCENPQHWRFEEESDFIDDCMHCGATYTKEEFGSHYDGDVFKPIEDEIFIFHCPKCQCVQEEK